MLLRSFCRAIFVVVPEPKNGSSTVQSTCCLPRSLQGPDLAEPFVALGLGEGAVVSRLVVGWEFSEAAFSE
jgi:hypothetical protein